MNELPDDLREPFVELLLSIADDKFVLGHRNSDWTGLAPILEEDIAFSSLAQDELAHASALYQLAAGLRGTSADKIAFGRRPEEYRCAELVELSDEFDWAVALARSWLCDHFDAVRLDRLAHSVYQPAAQLAVRLAAEERIHVEHADGWIARLGRAGGEARTRLQAGINRLMGIARSLLEPPAGVEKLERANVYPGDSGSMLERWQGVLASVAARAGLSVEIAPPIKDYAGGRSGKHGDAFGPMLDELTEVYRLEPDAAW